jgi:hypothetical protein
LNVRRLSIELVPQVVALEVLVPLFTALPLAVEISRQTLGRLPQAKVGFVHVFLRCWAKSISGITNGGDKEGVGSLSLRRRLHS